MASKNGRNCNLIPMCVYFWTFTVIAVNSEFSNADEKLNYWSSTIVNGGPVDPAVLDYLADQLQPHECAQLTTFLALHNKKVLPSANAKNLRDWGGNVRDRRGRPNTFPCHRTLKLWNDNIATIEAEDKIDGREYVENIIQYGLKQIHRQDMADWMVNLAEQRLKAGIRILEQEEEIHMQHGKENITSSEPSISLLESISSNTVESIFDETDDEIDIQRDLPPQIYLIIVFATLGALLVTIISVTIWYCSRREPELVRYKGEDLISTSRPRKLTSKEKVNAKDEEFVPFVIV